MHMTNCLHQAWPTCVTSAPSEQPPYITCGRSVRGQAAQQQIGHEAESRERDMVGDTEQEAKSEAGDQAGSTQ